MVQGKTFREMTDDELKVAAMSIVTSSSSEEEIKERLKRELDYPYSIAITSHVPTDNIGRGARAIAQSLGGLTMQNGAMVMVMMHGRNGNTISL